MKFATPTTVCQFMRSQTEPSYEHRITFAEIWERWREWCIGQRTYCATKNWLGRQLGKMGYTKLRAHTKVYYLGLAWKDV